MLPSKLPTPLAKQVISMLVKGIKIMVCLLAISLFIMPVLNKSPSMVVATWQKIKLLQEALPMENSLPSPLPNVI